MDPPLHPEPPQRTQLALVLVGPPGVKEGRRGGSAWDSEITREGPCEGEGRLLKAPQKTLQCKASTRQHGSMNRIPTCVLVKKPLLGSYKGSTKTSMAKTRMAIRFKVEPSTRTEELRGPHHEG